MAQKIIKKDNLWNEFDEKGLIVGLDRKLGEDIRDYRNRIVNHVDGDSTQEGLSDWVLNLFDQNDINPSGIINTITNTYSFVLNGIPLSKSEYVIDDEPYIYPVIYDFDDRVFDENDNVIEWIGYELEAGAVENEQIEQASYDQSADGKWTLYKYADGAYSNILIANYPATKIKVEYMSKINDVIYIVEESPERPA